MQSGIAPSPAQVRVFYAAASFEPPAVVLTPAEQARVSRLRSPDRRHAVQTTRWLLAQAPDGTHTSLAHSGRISAVGWSDWRIGVDVEAVRERGVMRIAEFAFSTDEAAQLRMVEPSQQLQHFHLLWVMKEACAKAFEWPLLDALRRCVFVRAGDAWHGRVADEPCRVQVFEPEGAIYIAVAVRAREVAMHCSRAGESAWATWPVRVDLTC